MQPEDYWVGLMRLVVFEAYGLGFKHETRPWAHVLSAHAQMVERFLSDLERECRANYLDYQADEALQQLAWMAVAGRRFSRYAGVAAPLGSDHWMPIVAMAESALRSEQRDLAVEVFRAADRPGFQQKFLRERCVALTGVDPAGEKEPLRGSMSPPAVGRRTCRRSTVVKPAGKRDPVSGESYWRAVRRSRVALAKWVR